MSGPLTVDGKKRTSGRPCLLLDPRVRSDLVMLAGTGLSRRGCALRAGIDPVSLLNYLERGRAHPDDEPWGSFARQFLAASRGVEQTAAEVQQMRVQWMHETQKRAMEWKPVEVEGVELPGQVPPDPPSTKDFEWLLKYMSSRFPDDHGAHQLREKEAEPSGKAFLERNAIEHGQLVALLREPSEPVVKALLEAFPQLEGVVKSPSAPESPPQEPSHTPASPADARTPEE